MNDDLIKFGNWLVQARKNSGMTLDEAEAACGVSRSTITNLERGKTKGIRANTHRILDTFFRKFIKEEPPVIENLPTASDKLVFDSNSFEFTRNRLALIADTILSDDFMQRVEDATKILRIPKKDAVIYILEATIRM